MSQCPFAAPGRQEACLSLQKSREAAMKRPYDRNDCYSCAMRRKRLEGEKPPERIAIPAADINGRTAKPTGAGRVIWDPVQARFGEEKPPTEMNPPREETGVIDDKARERVLSRISREKACSRGRLMNYCGVAKDELTEIVDALVAEGKIKAWPKGSGAIYTPPDAPDPSESSTEAPTKRASTPREPVANSRRAPKPERPASAKKPPGNGVYAAVIADFEAQRTVALDRVEKFDRLIEMLRALA